MPSYVYLYEQKQQQQLIQKLVQDPLFQPMINFFLDPPQQDIILRGLKQAFPDEPTIDLFIDQLVQTQLIERAQRRYRLRFPFFSKEASAKLLIDNQLSYLSFLSKQDQPTLFYLLGEWLWPALFEQEQDYFFALSQETYANLFFKVTASAKHWTLVSIQSSNTETLNLATYFSILANGQALPKAYRPLETLLGDVSIDYFASQLTKIKRSLKRERPNRNIFKEALQLTEDLQVNEQGQVVFKTACMNIEALKLPVAECSIAKTMLTQLFADQNDPNERVLQKMFFYQAIVNHYWREEEPIRYFLNK